MRTRIIIRSSEGAAPKRRKAFPFVVEPPATTVPFIPVELGAVSRKSSIIQRDEFGYNALLYPSPVPLPFVASNFEQPRLVNRYRLAEGQVPNSLISLLTKPPFIQSEWIGIFRDKRARFDVAPYNGVLWLTYVPPLPPLINVDLSFKHRFIIPPVPDFYLGMASQTYLPVFHLLYPTQRYITSAEDVDYYITKLMDEDQVYYYIGSTSETDMPQAQNFRPIDAYAQNQTVTFDFGAGTYLPEGVTLIGTPTISVSVLWGEDADPASRITGGPTIGTAPAPIGSGRTDTAILVQFSNCPGPLAYLVQVVCQRSDGDKAPMDAVLPVRVPG